MQKLALAAVAVAAVIAVAIAVALQRDGAPAARAADSRAEPSSRPSVVAADAAISDASLPATTDERIAVDATASELRASDSASKSLSISGVVVDESGAPIADATVSADLTRFHDPLAPGARRDVLVVGDRMVSVNGRLLPDVPAATTNRSGEFVLESEDPSPLRFVLSVTAPNFRNYRDSDDRSATAGRAWGDTGVRIVMHSSPRARFVVVESSTGAPIERFGLRLLGARYGKADEVAIEEFERGVCERTQADGFDQYELEAPGYAPVEGQVEDSALSPAGQTIAMLRGGSIHARVLLDGKPVRTCTAQVAGSRSDMYDPRLWARASQRDRELWLSDHPVELSAFLGRVRSIGDADGGELKFEDLPTGTFTLEVKTTSGEKLEIKGIQVTAGVATDLGDLLIESYPSIRITVLFPGDRAPGVYRLSTKCAEQSTQHTLDYGNHCEVHDLPPGHWSIEAPAEPNFVADGPSIEFDFTAGEKRDITLDLRQRGGGWLGVTALVNGERAAGITMNGYIGDRLVADGIHTRSDGRAIAWFGSTDAIDLQFLDVNGVPLGRERRKVNLQPGSEVEVTCELRAGELALDLGALTGIEPGAHLNLELESPEMPEMPSPLHFSTSLPDPPHFRPGAVTFTPSGGSLVPSRDVPLRVGAGHYRARFSFAVRDREARWSEHVDYARDIDIRAHELTEVRFTDADRVK